MRDYTPDAKYDNEPADGSYRVRSVGSTPGANIPRSGLDDATMRLRVLRDRIAQLITEERSFADALIGEAPPRTAADQTEPHEAPPYGGKMSELFYATAELEHFVSELEAVAQRKQRVA